MLSFLSFFEKVFWCDVKVKIVLSVLCLGLFVDVFVLKRENKREKEKVSSDKAENHFGWSLFHCFNWFVNPWFVITWSRSQCIWISYMVVWRCFSFFFFLSYFCFAKSRTWLSNWVEFSCCGMCYLLNCKPVQCVNWDSCTEIPILIGIYKFSLKICIDLFKKIRMWTCVVI